MPPSMLDLVRARQRYGNVAKALGWDESKHVRGFHGKWISMGGHELKLGDHVHVPAGPGEAQHHGVVTARHTKLGVPHVTVKGADGRGKSHPADRVEHSSTATFTQADMKKIVPLPHPFTGNAGLDRPMKVPDHTVGKVQNALKRAGHFPTKTHATAIRGYQTRDSGYEVRPDKGGNIYVTYVRGGFGGADDGKHLQRMHDDLKTAGFNVEHKGDHLSVRGDAKHHEQIATKLANAESELRFADREIERLRANYLKSQEPKMREYWNRELTKANARKTNIWLRVDDLKKVQPE